MLSGHLPRLARLIQQDRLFRKRITRVHVDEAHFIYTTGVELYGLPAFRPAWGQLGEFRIKLGKGVVFQALSGTQPPHIKKTIIDRLLFDEKNLCNIKRSSNRPNMGYATHAIVGNLSDFRNLDFLVPEPYPDDFLLPKTLVFHDNVNECTAAAVYLNDRLPKSLRSKGLVKHYHGGMSKEYLTLVYDDFQQRNGACRILHATEGASTVILSSFSDSDAFLTPGT
jgi:superfamily II DNA helicase RecQ